MERPGLPAARSGRGEGRTQEGFGAGRGEWGSNRRDGGSEREDVRSLVQCLSQRASATRRSRSEFVILFLKDGIFYFPVRFEVITFQIYSTFKMNFLVTFRTSRYMQIFVRMTKAYDNSLFMLHCHYLHLQKSL